MQTAFSIPPEPKSIHPSLACWLSDEGFDGTVSSRAPQHRALVVEGVCCCKQVKEIVAKFSASISLSLPTAQAPSSLVSLVMQRAAWTRGGCESWSVQTSIDSVSRFGRRFGLRFSWFDAMPHAQWALSPCLSACVRASSVSRPSTDRCWMEFPVPRSDAFCPASLPVRPIHPFPPVGLSVCLSAAASTTTTTPVGLRWRIVERISQLIYTVCDN